MDGRCFKCGECGNTRLSKSDRKPCISIGETLEECCLNKIKKYFDSSNFAVYEMLDELIIYVSRLCINDKEGFHDLIYFRCCRYEKVTIIFEDCAVHCDVNISKNSGKNNRKQDNHNRYNSQHQYEYNDPCAGLVINSLDFRNTTFKCDFNCVGTEFLNTITFNESVFIGKAIFDSAVFYKQAEFMKSMFRNTISFVGSRFNDISTFSECILGQEIDSNSDTHIKFEHAKFVGETDFTGANFNYISYYNNAVFANKSSFSSCTFNRPVDFFQASFHEHTSFAYTKFQQGASFRDVNFARAAFFQKVKIGENNEESNHLYELNVIGVTSSDGGFCYFEGFDGNAMSKIEFRRPDLEVIKFINCQWNSAIKIDNSKDKSINHYRELEETYRALKKIAVSEHDMLMVSNWHSLEKKYAFTKVYSEFKKIDCRKIKDKLNSLSQTIILLLYQVSCGFGEDLKRAFSTLAWLFAYGYFLSTIYYIQSVGPIPLLNIDYAYWQYWFPPMFPGLLLLFPQRTRYANILKLISFVLMIVAICYAHIIFHYSYLAQRGISIGSQVSQLMGYFSTASKVTDTTVNSRTFHLNFIAPFIMTMWKITFTAQLALMALTIRNKVRR